MLSAMQKRKLFILCYAAFTLMNNAPGFAQEQRNIVSNPINLNYRFMIDGTSRREAADPVLEYFKGKYYLFASKSGGYWSSKDLCEWNYIPCKSISTIEAYAPTIMEYKDELYFLASGPKFQVFKTKNPDTDNWEAVDMQYTRGGTDPTLFKDDDGKVYLYWGCSDKSPITGIQVDPDNGFKAIGQEVVLITHNEDKYGWEVQGENNELNKPGWNEGPTMIKYKGKYYLQYASPGTQFRTYGDGAYISHSPLGPFTYVESTPFSFKPGGFIGGAGHGHTFKDKYGNYWHVATMKISIRQNFERRLGLFPSYFADDDMLYSHTVWTDYPFQVPQKKTDFRKTDCSMGWNILSFNKKIYASSELPRYEAVKANDEHIESWWAANSGKPGEWLKIDLGKPMTVNAIQVNLADHNFKLLGPDYYCYQYIIECSSDGTNWQTLIDRTSNNKDMPHELIVLNKPTKTRFIRIKNTKEIPGCFSLYDFRIFGNGNGLMPQNVSNVTVLRNDTDKRIIRLNWKEDKTATGYIVRWGIDKNKLHSSKMVYSNSFEGRFFNRSSKYYFSIDSFNESGVKEYAGEIISVD